MICIQVVVLGGVVGPEAGYLGAYCRRLWSAAFRFEDVLL